MKSFLLFTALLLLATSCEEKPFDYRNRYTGNYRMHVVYSKWQLNLGTYETGDYFFDGRVWYDEKKDEKDVLHFAFSDGEEFVLRADKDGKIYCYDQVGKFGKKKFALTLVHPCSNGLMGQNADYNITAERK